MSILDVAKLSKRFGGLVAVDSVDLRIEQGEIVGLIGPNGAGKTTIFNLICGSIPITSGQIWFKNEDITGIRPYQACRKGIARTFQSVNLFRNLTVLENVLMGSLFGALEPMQEAREEAKKSLEFVGLLLKQNLQAKDLTVGDQKRLEVARALATRPALLLLDEVMAGLNQTELSSAIELIRKINSTGITIFVIEHVMHAIMGISNRVIVLHHGQKLCEGTPNQVCNDSEVIKIYLGG